MNPTLRWLLLMMMLRVWWAPHNFGTFAGWVNATLDGKPRQRYAIVELENGKHKMVAESDITTIEAAEEEK